MNRREFLGTVAAAAAFPALRGQAAGSGTPASEWGPDPASKGLAAPNPPWPSPSSTLTVPLL